MAFATNNAERMRVTGSGQILVNTDAALPIGSTGTGVQIAETGLQLSRWNASAAGAPAFIYAGRSKSATIGTNAAVANNDELFRIGCYGADGTTFVEAARISAFCDAATGTNDMAGRLVFSTTADGSSTPTERMRIDSAGNVGIGTASPNASAILHLSSTTKGFLPPILTTAQRDAISSPAEGLMVYNATTNKLNFYNGTAWEAVTSA
jgi:hypothetical protein